MFSLCEAVGRETNTYANMKSALTGLKFFYSVGLTEVILESDSCILVNWLEKKKKRTIMSYNNIWLDILQL